MGRLNNFEAKIQSRQSVSQARNDEKNLKKQGKSQNIVIDN